jgi:glycosyltransferase involved in cell wall biosynthesis
MRVTVATTFATHPPDCGAALRNFHLYRHVARFHQVEIVALVKQDSGRLDQMIAAQLREIRVPISDAHLSEELRVCEKASGRPVQGLAVARLYRLSPEYLQALDASCRRADVLIASHPNLIYALREVSQKPLVYEAPDVEYDLMQALLPDTNDGRDLLSRVALTESHCLAEAERVFACSEEDRERFHQIYATPLEKISVVPNGADLEGIAFKSSSERRRERARSGKPFTCLFLASWAEFNIAAAERIIDWAASLPDIEFVIAGSVGLPLRSRSLPRNVVLTGTIDNAEKLRVLHRADVALNPAHEGSGSNVKIGEYASAGLPIVTTPFGLRGTGAAEAFPAIVCEIGDFADTIRRLADPESEELLDQRSRSARAWCEKHRSWEAIGEKLAAQISEVAGPLAAATPSKRERISVLIPMLNAKSFIEECVQSALTQTYPNIEVLVVDDGCSDGSPAIVRSIAQRDGRVRLLQHPHRENHGVSRSIELALRHSRGEYVALLDADDAFEPDKLSKQIALMREHPEAVLCHTLATVLAEPETELSRAAYAHFDDRPSAPLYWLLKEPRELGMCHVLNSSAMIKAAVLRQLPFGGRQVYQSEDWLIIAMLALHGPFLFLPERLTKYRVHSGSYTASVLANPISDLYSRLEMFLKLLPHAETRHMTQMIEYHMQGVLWSLEREYAQDAPARASPRPLREQEALTEQSKGLIAEVLKLQGHLQELQASQSWRLTRPLRQVMTQWVELKRRFGGTGEK